MTGSAEGGPLSPIEIALVRRQARSVPMVLR